MMFSPQNDMFEVEENHVEFKEVCSRLKNHTFPSPWNIFFKDPETEEFIPEVSEFVLEDMDAFKDFHTLPSLPDKPSEVSINAFKRQMTSSDVLLDKGDTKVVFVEEMSDKGVQLRVTFIFLKHYPKFGRFDNSACKTGGKWLMIEEKETNKEKKVSRLKESLMSAQGDNTVEYLQDFDIFFITASSQIPLLFQMLDISALNDNAVSLLLNAFLHYKDQISIATASALVHYVVCSVIFEMKRSSSRFLLTTILKFAEVYPKSIVDEIMIPYSKKSISDDVQSEILFQIAKTNLPNEYVPYTIKNVLENASPTENTFALLQCLIERKSHHDTTLNDLVLKKLLDWTSTCNKNVKFTKLLTSILFAYGNEFTEQQILLCDEVVKNNKTIIKKAAENLLKRLKQESG